MADSDSGTHVTDISESVQDDLESRKEALLGPIMDLKVGTDTEETKDTLSTAIIPNQGLTENIPLSANKDLQTSSEPQHKNGNKKSPHLTRANVDHAQSRAVSPTRHTPSPICYTINHDTSRACHVPSRSTSPVQLVARGHYKINRSVSRSRGSRAPSRVSSPVHHSSSHAASLAQYGTSRANSSQGRLSRRRSMRTGSDPCRAGIPHLTYAHEHSAQRRYGKLNGNIASEGQHAVPAKRMRRAPQKSVPYGGPLQQEDNLGFTRSIDSIRLSSGSRTAYDFMDLNRRVATNPNVNSAQEAIMDIDLKAGDARGLDANGEGKPWLPTGIYAVFLITLWTAVVKLVDSVEENGPSTCTEGEETRLWVCAGSFALVQGLAEAFWQRKNLLKVLFSTSCLFAYFIILHTEPLSCRLGEENVTELSKWQSALNFFVSALLGICIYMHIRKVVQERKKKKEREKEKRRREGVDFDDFEELPEFVL